jgi:unsaturated rhamnogalacturonyl hydrolase
MAYWFYRWDWGEAIALDGLMSAGSILANPAPSDFARDATLAWLGDGEVEKLDAMGPANVLMDMVDEGIVPDEDLAVRALGSLVGRLLDTGEGIGGISPQGRDSVLFVDALYGYPSLGIRFGLRIDSQQIVDRMCRLVLQHCSHLQSQESGFFSHFASVDRPTDVASTWGRGNGWALLGLSDLLLVLPKDHELYGEIQDCFKVAVDALRSVQTGEGFFRNIVDQRASYPESSATAMIEAAVSQGIATGNLDSGYATMADAAWDAFQHRIDTNGHLVGVSYRPGVNDDLRRYEHTPAIGSYPWGQGAYLRSALPRLRLTLNGK